MNCSINLLKKPIITTQTRALSHEGCPLQHLHIASCRLTPLHNLKLCWSNEGKSTQIIIAFCNVCCVDNILGGSSCHANNIETIRILCNQRIKIPSTLNGPCLMLLCILQMGRFVALKKTRPLKTFFFLKPFSGRHGLMVVGLQSAPVTTLI